MNDQNKIPDISVIIPVYNGEKYLKKSLNSVAAQTFNNFEVIIVDDGSEDNSLYIIKEYENKYSNFKWFSIKKNGVSVARNIGIEKSRGKYLSFIDSDDFVLPNFLEILYNNMKENNTDIACCNYYLYWPKRNFYIKNVICLPSGVYSSDKALYSLVKDVRLHFFLWNKLWKKSLFTDNNIKFPQNKCYEDVYACLRAFYFSKSISVISAPLYFYTRRNDSYESSTTLKKYQDYIAAFQYIRIFLNSQGKYNKYRISHIILGMRMILSSIPMSFSVRRCARGKQEFFYEFKFAVKSIFYCISNKFKSISDII
ncbi:MAG: glycosyltransferase family 2 protein [Oscillospiraceae bacterium]|nr:glycosyltransferase family 2 protein [Oscillospiraceae bacterium]